MKRFALYYKKERLSHCKLHGAIEAENSTNAFIKAVNTIRAGGLDPDEFREFYIVPVTPDNSVQYKMQCYGWDESGDFPR